MSGADREKLEGRLNATNLVGDVVEALWALARAQLPRAAAATAEATTYLDWVDDAVAQLAEPAPLAAEEASRLVVVIGPERAFAGGLPRRVVDQALALLRAEDRVGWVGRRMVENVPASRDVQALFEAEGVCSVDEVEEAAEELAGLVLEHATDGSVVLVHPRARHDELQVATLLVGSLERRRGAAAPDTYSPPAVILARAVRMGVAARLRVALMETFLAETHARVIATESARRAIDRKRTELERTLGVLRQEAITTEIAESFGSRQSRARHRGRSGAWY